MSDDPAARPWWQWALALVVLLGAGFGVGAAWQPSTDLSQHTGERFVEFVFLGALGVLATFFVDDLKRKGERRTMTHDRRRDAERRSRSVRAAIVRAFLARLDELYQSVKVVRRQLRLTAGYDLSSPIERDVYLDAIIDLNDQQLILEQVRHAIGDIGDDVLGKRPGRSSLSTLKGHLETMENYLDALQQEAEQQAHTLGPTVEAGKLDRLRGFAIGKHHPGGGSNFADFSSAYHNVRGLLLHALVDIEQDDEVTADHGSS